MGPPKLLLQPLDLLLRTSGLLPRKITLPGSSGLVIRLVCRTRTIISVRVPGVAPGTSSLGVAPRPQCAPGYPAARYKELYTLEKLLPGATSDVQKEIATLKIMIS